MANFADDIEEAAGSEAIECIVIGGQAWDGEREIPHHFRDALNPDDLFIPMSWAHARPMLNREYDDGFGAAECPPVYAWTATRVITVHEYDGSTTVGVVPRHPAEGLRPTFA